MVMSISLYERKWAKNSNWNMFYWPLRQTSPKVHRHLTSGQNSFLRFGPDFALNGCNGITHEWAIFNLKAAMLLGTFFVKKYSKICQIRLFQLSFLTIMWKGTSWVCASKKREMTYLQAALTFFRRGGFAIWQALQNRGWMLHHICEIEPKIPSFNHHFWCARQTSQGGKGGPT